MRQTDALQPMDKVVRQNYAATKRFNNAEFAEDSDESESTLQDPSSTAESDDDDNPPSRQQKIETKPRQLPVRQSARSIVRDRPAPNYKRSWHPIDDLKRSKATNEVNVNISIVISSQEEAQASDSSEPRSKAKTPLRREKSPEQSREDLNRRRSARKSASGREPVYDSKLHPMDKALRPKFAAQRTASKMESVTIAPPSRGRNVNGGSPAKRPVTPQKSLSSNSKLSVENPPVLSHNSQVIPLVSSRLSNPFGSPRQRDWYQLQDIDRRVYILQQGAPVRSQTLPMKWDEVKEILFEEGDITFDELNSAEGTLPVKERYENIRLGIEVFFDVKKPEVIDKKQWTIYHAEQLSVFQSQRGAKYWRHLADSIIGPIPITARKIELGQVEDSDDGIDEDGNKDALPSAMLQSDELLPSYDDNDETLIGQDDHSNLESTYVKSIQDLDHTVPRGEYEMMDSAELEKLLAPINRFLSDHGEDPTAKLTTAPELDTMQLDDALPTQYKARKGKAKAKAKDEAVKIHEDEANRSPELKRYVAMNPASPGTDVPKENMSSQGSGAAEQSSHPSTPYANRFRAVFASPRSALSNVGAAITGPYTSLFGGPEGLGSPS